MTSQLNREKLYEKREGKNSILMDSGGEGENKIICGSVT